jgi:hypothetical protein
MASATDRALAGITPESLLRLFELVGIEKALEIWNALPDEKGIHARALLEKGAHSFGPELVAGFEPKLNEYLSAKSASASGRDEILNMQFHEAFIDLAWPYIKTAMLSHGEIAPKDTRLLSHYHRDSAEFHTLVVTTLALQYATLFVHPGLKKLRLPRFHRDQTQSLRDLIFVCGPALAEIAVDEGIVPELLDILHQTRNKGQRVVCVCPQVSFGEMLWMARWWLETRDAGIVIRAHNGERWVPRAIQRVEVDEVPVGPPRIVPGNPPLRGKKRIHIRGCAVDPGRSRDAEKRQATNRELPGVRILRSVGHASARR